MTPPGRRKLLEWAALPSILALATGLRVWGLAWGPPIWHPDEYSFIYWPLNFFSGDLNPHFFTYPTFHYYLLGLLYAGDFLWQRLFAAGWSLSQWVAFHYFWEPDSLLTLARWTTVVMGVGTVGWVYALAGRVYGRPAGWIAALLVAICAIHVRQSFLAAVDVPLTFWFVGAVWAGVRLLERQGVKDYALAGVLVGLAAGTKYPGALASAAVIAGHLLGGRSLLDRRLWLAGLTTLGVFVLVSPYVVLDFGGFLTDLRPQVRHVGEGHGQDLGWAWWYYLTVCLRYGLGWGGLVLGAVAVGQALRSRQRAGWVVLGAFLVYYLGLGSGKMAFVRYALPLMVLQGVLLSGVIQAVPRAAWRIALVGLVALEPFYASLRVAQLAGQPDTRLEAQAWAEAHLPPGATCCNFGGWAGDVLLRTFERHWWRIEHFERAFGQQQLDQVLGFLEQHRPTVPYYSYAILGMNQGARAGSIDMIERYECAYVLVHRHPLLYSTVDAEFAEELARRGERLAQFVPKGSAQATPRYDPIDAYYLPIGDFGSLQQTGPEIEIWRIKRPIPPVAQVQNTTSLFAHGYASGAFEILDKNDPQRARDLAERAVGLDPQGPEGYAALAQVYLYQGDHLQAIRTYQQLLAWSPGDAESHNNLGIACWTIGRGEEARQHWQQALQLQPGTAGIHYNLALAYYLSEERDTGQDSMAVHHLEQALSLQPHMAEAAYLLGLVHYRASRYAAAIPYLKKALTLGVVRPELFVYLEKACEQTGQTTEAEQGFNEVFGILPDHPQASEIRRALVSIP